MTNWSIVPDLCDQLVAVFTAAAPTAAAALPPAPDGTPAQLPIYDGPPTTDLADNYVAVGYSGAFAGSGFSGTTGLAVEGRWGESDVGNRIPFENFAVQCEASTYSGDSDPGSMSRQRLRTRAVLSAMVAALMADQSLGGLVKPPAHAMVGTFRWLFDQAADGAAVTVQFSVEIVGEEWLI